MSDSRADRERAAERRRRLAEAFGDPLPRATRDEKGDSWGEIGPRGGADDDWLRSQVPPHHG